jgi:catechol 2,3-dioxygenase-like lactoylglutathione lyase family enzyme
MDWKIEVVVLPVSDVARAKEFYADTLGFRVDSDFHPNDDFHVVQVTPPGSACSIVFGTGMGSSNGPGSVQGTHLVVDDIEAALAHLEAQGIATSGVQHFEDGVMTPGPDPEDKDYASFVFFADPDGNSWAVQQIRQHVR